MLEALSGIPFSRDRTLVTRCAIQISIVLGTKWKAEIRVGIKVVTVAIENKTEITAQIEKMMKFFLCGSDTFCAMKLSRSINREYKLRVPGLPDLTLIDLPGIVRTAANRQDEKVIEQVIFLLNQYLAQPRTVILAVIPGCISHAGPHHPTSRRSTFSSGPRKSILMELDLSASSQSPIWWILERRQKCWQC